MCVNNNVVYTGILCPFKDSVGSNKYAVNRLMCRNVGYAVRWLCHVVCRLCRSLALNIYVSPISPVNK